MKTQGVLALPASPNTWQGRLATGDLLTRHYLKDYGEKRVRGREESERRRRENEVKSLKDNVRNLE